MWHSSYISTLCKTLTFGLNIKYAVSKLLEETTVCLTVLDLTRVRYGNHTRYSDNFFIIIHIDQYIFQCQQFSGPLGVFAMFRWPRSVHPSCKNSMTRNCCRLLPHQTKLSRSPRKTYVCECN